VIEKSVLKGECSEAFADVISLGGKLEKLPKLGLVRGRTRNTKEVADHQTFKQTLGKVVTIAENVVVIQLRLIAKASFVSPDRESTLEVLPEKMGKFFVFDLFDKNENVKQVFGRTKSKLSWCQNLLF
jgi:hypothetical protein